jgi:DNA sulfur modification protein DndE
VREVAAAYKAPLLDMHKKSLDLLVSLGPDSSKRIFLWIRPGEYKSLPNGREDNTHFSDYGATLMAQIAVSCMKEQKLELATHLRK